MNSFLTRMFVLLVIFGTTSVNAEITFKVDGISGDEEANVISYLASLDAPKNADDDDYLGEVEKSAQAALSVFGYYQSSIVINVSETETSQTVNLLINAGPETYIAETSLKILGEGANTPMFLEVIESVEIRKGSVLIHTNYEAVKGSLKSLARRYGYFDAKFEKSHVDVSSLNNTASVHLWFDTGPRYQFGELVFTSELPAEKYVRSLLNFAPGDPFDTRLLSEFNSDLSETGYFRSITILPEFSEKSGLQVPLHVVGRMRPQDSFNTGLGYTTDEGVRGKLRWSRPWVNEYGHSIEGNIVGSIPKQEASLIYKMPLEDPLYNYTSIQTGYKMLNQNDTDTTQYILGFNRHWRLSNDWMRTAFIRYEHEQGLQGQQDFSTSLIIPGVSFSRTRSRGGINTTWGDKIMASLEVSNEWWLSSDDLVKVYGQTKMIRTYSGHQFVGFVELGAIYTDSIYNVPSSMRFFTGGDQSIRGFDYESIAPSDSQGYLLGGRYLTVGSLEYRFPISESWKFALFGDMGTATDDFSEEISSSVGGGVVWASPVGPIRFYVARPITNAVNDYSIHFMIGPEL